MLSDLSPEEAAELARIKETIAAELKPECDAVSAAWLQERGKYLEARGVDPEKAKRVLTKAAETYTL